MKISKKISSERCIDAFLCTSISVIYRFSVWSEHWNNNLKEHFPWRKASCTLMSTYLNPWSIKVLVGLYEWRPGHKIFHHSPWLTLQDSRNKTPNTNKCDTKILVGWGEGKISWTCWYPFLSQSCNYFTHLALKHLRLHTSITVCVNNWFIKFLYGFFEYWNKIWILWITVYHRFNFKETVIGGDFVIRVCFR